MRSHLHSRTSNKNNNLTGQLLDNTSLQQNHSAANFANTASVGGMQPSHQRKKLPIGFLVQKEKRELHKMGTQNGSKIRPDSAKPTLKNNARALDMWKLGPEAKPENKIDYSE